MSIIKTCYIYSWTCVTYILLLINIKAMQILSNTGVLWQFHSLLLYIYIYIYRPYGEWKYQSMDNRKIAVKLLPEWWRGLCMKETCKRAHRKLRCFDSHRGVSQSWGAIITVRSPSSDWKDLCECWIFLINFPCTLLLVSFIRRSIFIPIFVLSVFWYFHIPPGVCFMYLLLYGEGESLSSLFAINFLSILPLSYTCHLLCFKFLSVNF